MDIYPALLLFTFIIIVYWIIVELFTFFFHLTGLTADRSRFQVISLLTGTGFTTRESELVLSTRRRRRLARVTMLFGYVFNITIVSAFINVFLSMKSSQVSHQFLGFLIPLSAVVLIFIVMRVPKIRARIDNFLHRLADRFFDRTESFNAVLLVDNIGTESIAQVKLRPGRNRPPRGDRDPGDAGGAQGPKAGSPSRKYRIRSRRQSDRLREL